MNPSATLSPPERAARPDPELEPEPGTVTPRRGVDERNRRYRRAMRWGLAGAVLLHLLVVRVSPFFVKFAEYVETWWTPPPPAAQGTEIVLLREVDGEPVAPPPIVERRPPPAEERAPATTAPAEPAPGAAELLRPRVGDWRLVVPPPLTTRERALTRAEREALLNARVRGLLAAANDSAAAAASREAAALDWTVGDEDSRWGVSPGKIHLGGVEIPLPFSLGPNPAQAREQAERLDSYDAIRRQAGQAAADESFEERVKAIRERREAERRKEKEGTPADTTKKPPD